MREEFSTGTVLKYRNEIFGISAIWILFFHIRGYVGFPGGVFAGVSYILSIGNAGVDVFLFLSSIGLFGSMRKNNVKRFYLNRINRLLIPYLIVAVPFFAWYDFVYAQDGLSQYVKNVSTINFWLTGIHPTWYVAFSILAYAVFPEIYKLLCNKKQYMVLLLICLAVISEIVLFYSNNPLIVNCEKAFSRIPIFLLSGMGAVFFYEKRMISGFKVFLLGCLGGQLSFSFSFLIFQLSQSGIFMVHWRYA